MRGETCPLFYCEIKIFICIFINKNDFLVEIFLKGKKNSENILISLYTIFV